jgi:hypothetical protein
LITTSDPACFAGPLPHGGDTSRALDWLERAHRERTFLLPFLLHPVYDPLRSQPRFQRIVRDIGLTIPPVSGPPER